MPKPSYFVLLTAFLHARRTGWCADRSTDRRSSRHQSGKSVQRGGITGDHEQPFDLDGAHRNDITPAGA